MDVKSLNKGTLSLPRDDFWVVMLYPNVPVHEDREKKIETGDGQVNRTRKGGGL